MGRKRRDPLLAKPYEYGEMLNYHPVNGAYVPHKPKLIKVKPTKRSGELAIRDHRIARFEATRERSFLAGMLGIEHGNHVPKDLRETQGYWDRHPRPNPQPKTYVVVKSPAMPPLTTVTQRASDIHGRESIRDHAETVMRDALRDYGKTTYADPSTTGLPWRVIKADSTR